MNSLNTHYDIYGNLVSNKKTVEKFTDNVNTDDTYGYEKNVEYAQYTCNIDCETPMISDEKDFCYKNKLTETEFELSFSKSDDELGYNKIECNIDVDEYINKSNFDLIKPEQKLNAKLNEIEYNELDIRIDPEKSLNEIINDDPDDGYIGNRISEFFNMLREEKQKIIDASINYDKKNPKERLNYYPYICDVTHCYLKALEDYGIKNKTKIRNIVRSLYYNISQEDKGKFIQNLVGDEKTFKKDLEKALGFSLDVISGFSNGVSYDEKGNLREHRGGTTGGSYLITALTHSKLLSIGKVNKLRLIMNQAFENPENRKLMAFYYENFKSVADHLTENDQLKQLLPLMEQVNNFNDYVKVCYQAVDLANSTGFDGESLRQTFESFDKTINQLPHPNTLFDKIKVN